MRSSWIIATVAAIGLIARASAQDVHQDTRQEAEKLIFAYAATFNKQDAAGLAAFYTKDGVIINQRGVISGPSAIEEYLQTLFLLRHEFLRRDGPAIGALQQGHRDRVLTRAPISRRRMVAIEFGM